MSYTHNRALPLSERLRAIEVALRDLEVTVAMLTDFKIPAIWDALIELEGLE